MLDNSFSDGFNHTWYGIHWMLTILNVQMTSSHHSGFASQTVIAISFCVIWMHEWLLARTTYASKSEPFVLTTRTMKSSHVDVLSNGQRTNETSV